MKNLLRPLPLICIMCFAVHAQSDDPLERESLRGLPGVFVLITGLDTEVESGGLTAAQLKADVEVRLRQAGIRVFTLEELKGLPSKPALQVEVLVARSEALSAQLDETIYVFSIKAAVKQTATTLNAPNKVAYVTTWGTNNNGLASRANLKIVRDGVGVFVGRFINDFLAVNLTRRN